MYARVSTYSGDMTRFMTNFATVTDVLEQWNGLHHIDLLVSEETGRAIALSVWPDEDSMRRSDVAADDVRDRVVDRSGVKTESVEYFRLAATVHGPASKGVRPPLATGP